MSRRCEQCGHLTPSHATYESSTLRDSTVIHIEVPTGQDESTRAGILRFVEKDLFGENRKVHTVKRGTISIKVGKDAPEETKRYIAEQVEAALRKAIGGRRKGLDEGDLGSAA